MKIKIVNSPQSIVHGQTLIVKLLVISYSLLVIICSLFTVHCFPQVRISSSPGTADPSAILDVSGNNTGVLITRMTTTQRDQIIGIDGIAGHPPATGLLIFNTSTNCFEAYVNGSWNRVVCPSPCSPPASPAIISTVCQNPTSFTARWSASPGATSYYLDVATDAGFNNFSAGYNNINISNVTSFSVTGLNTGATYYYRVRASSACSSGNSSTITVTLTSAPAISAPAAGTNTIPTFTQIVWNWNTVTGATGYKYGTTNVYSSAIDNGTSTSFSQTGLICNTGYTLYVWAYNACEYSSYSLLTQIIPVCEYICGQDGTFIDSRDGKTYGYVDIGTQRWMCQNLNIGNFINGSINQSNNSTIEKYCFNDNENNCSVYGGLYQWDEMMQYVKTESTKGICTTGWHVPANGEWTTLTNYLGGNNIAAGKMKEAEYLHWNSPNTGADNSSRFTALPGGRRLSVGDWFEYLNGSAYFWSSTEDDTIYAWYRSLNYNNVIVSGYSDFKSYGFSVRCVKD
jgi:uncharacterized protein (TIGR02145 family)